MTSPYTHVQFETSVGTFVIELYYQHAPRTCYNMAALAKTGYYNQTIFHRIIADFMIQGGDPTGTGRGGKSIYEQQQQERTNHTNTNHGQKLEDEITRHLKHTGAGVVSMANSGRPNTNGSQFFITLKPLPSLDGKHTIFGRIYSGMSVIHRMSMVSTGKDDRPKIPITIHKATPFHGPPPSLEEQQIQNASSNMTFAQLTAASS